MAEIQTQISKAVGKTSYVPSGTTFCLAVRIPSHPSVSQSFLQSRLCYPRQQVRRQSAHLDLLLHLHLLCSCLLRLLCLREAEDLRAQAVAFAVKSRPSRVSEHKGGFLVAMCSKPSYTLQVLLDSMRDGSVNHYWSASETREMSEKNNIILQSLWDWTQPHRAVSIGSQAQWQREIMSQTQLQTLSNRQYTSYTSFNHHHGHFAAAVYEYVHSITSSYWQLTFVQILRIGNQTVILSSYFMPQKQYRNKCVLCLFNQYSLNTQEPRFYSPSKFQNKIPTF